MLGDTVRSFLSIGTARVFILYNFDPVYTTLVKFDVSILPSQLADITAIIQL